MKAGKPTLWCEHRPLFYAALNISKAGIWIQVYLILKPFLFTIVLCHYLLWKSFYQLYDPTYERPNQHSNFDTEATGYETLEYRYLWCNSFFFFHNILIKMSIYSPWVLLSIITWKIKWIWSKRNTICHLKRD